MEHDQIVVNKTSADRIKLFFTESPFEKLVKCLQYSTQGNR